VSLSISRAYWNDKKKERKARKISEEKCLVLVAILKSKTLQCQPVYYYYYYCYTPKVLWLKQFFREIVFTEKNVSRKKLFTRPYLYYPHHHATYCLLSPPPPYCCYVGSTYICIIKQKNYLFPILQKNTEIFSSPEFSHVEHICLVVEPP